jgi:hypothetical protein
MIVTGVGRFALVCPFWAFSALAFDPDLTRTSEPCFVFSRSLPTNRAIWARRCFREMWTYRKTAEIHVA